MKVSQWVEELLSEHDLTDRQMDIQTDIHTDIYGKNYMSPPDEGNIILRIERTGFVTDRKTYRQTDRQLWEKTMCLPQIRET